MKRLSQCCTRRHILSEYTCLLIFLAGSSRAQTFFRARGSAHDVGVQYGDQFRSQLQAVWNFKVNHQHAHVVDEWKQIARAAQSSIQKYAPLYWQELQGVEKGSSMSIEQLLMLAAEYEADMILASNRTRYSGRSTTSKGCTGFAMPASGWIGQTNDDHPANWANGTWDLVLHLELEELDFAPILIYTHVGSPAYLGMNAATGLGVTWYYVDDASRNYDHGLPTTVLIRQLLYQPSLNETTHFLKETPKSLPNAFLMLDSFHQEAVSMEVSPTELSTLRAPSTSHHLVHANHIVHSAQMWQHELRFESFDIGHKSVERFRVLNELLLGYGDESTHITPNQLFQMLGTPPIRNDETLATVVMNPRLGVFYILNNQTLCMQYNTTSTMSLHVRN